MMSLVGRCPQKVDNVFLFFHFEHLCVPIRLYEHEENVAS